MKKTYVIAEIGINHNGCLDTAKRLIDISAAAGCDAVKFQKRNPDVCVPEHQKNIKRETPWGEMTYLEYKYKVEFGQEEYDEIDRYCKQQKISWSASPWDLDSLEFLNQYDIPFIKIPSAMITNTELLEASCKTDKKIIISTGMSSIQEVNNAQRILSLFAKDYAILHCNSTYPAPIEELNLSCVKTLKDRFSWLSVNLVTAIIASMVIGLFQEEIEKIVALAVLMPIVASMGGNAGTQTVTVAVRALATRQLSYINLQKFVLRESWVGMFNGVLFAIFSSVLAYLWFNDFQIAIIMSASMVLNLLLAGILGTLIPLSLNKFKIDPAISSTILLTTATDVIGFFTFLGLAAWVIL